MASFPEFTRAAPSASKYKVPETLVNEFKIYIAIDFGTDGVALAYSIRDTQQVYVHQEWDSHKHHGVKPKTIVLLDEDHDVIAFGNDAKDTYMNATNKKVAKKWLLFERFKMALYDDGYEKKDNDGDEKRDQEENKIGIKQELTAVNGKTVKSSVVFIAVFKYLRKLTRKILKRKGVLKGIKSKDIQWIITVPAIWNDAAKLQMRQWTIDSGLVDRNIKDQCQIVYEPDCASLAIQHHINKQLTQISNFTDDPIDDVKQSEINHYYGDALKKGDKYILIDAGGGTVDIACHEVLGENGEFGVKEVLAPSGGAWGSCYIDDKFVEILEDLFSKEWIDEFKNTETKYYVHLIDNFQQSKKTFYQNSEQDVHNVELPLEFIEFMQDKLKQTGSNTQIEDFVGSSTLFGKSNLITLHGLYLVINVKGWKLMFDHVMDPMIKHIEKLLQEPMLMRNCKYLCLVGGLSSSPYFEAKMRKIFGPKSRYKLLLIVTDKPILAVVEGAAYFGITANYIKARVLQFTYGIILHATESNALRRGVPLDYIQKNKFLHDGTSYVRNCFLVIARKNEQVYVGDVKERKGHRPGRNSKICKLRIMVSELENPLVESDGKKLGILETVYTDEDDDDEEIMIEFHFYGTLIKLVSYKKRDPSIKQTGYLVNYQ